MKSETQRSGRLHRTVSRGEVLYLSFQAVRNRMFCLTASTASFCLTAQNSFLPDNRNPKRKRLLSVSSSLEKTPVVQKHLRSHPQDALGNRLDTKLSGDSATRQFKENPKEKPPGQTSRGSFVENPECSCFSKRRIRHSDQPRVETQTEKTMG